MSLALKGQEFDSDPIQSILENVDETVETAILTELRRVYDAIPEQVVTREPEVFLGGILVPSHMKNIFTLTETDRNILFEALGLRLEKAGNFFDLFATVNSPNPANNSRALMFKFLTPTPRK